MEKAVNQISSLHTIFQNKKYWEHFSEDQLQEYANQIFIHYRNVGFPLVYLSPEERKKDFDNLCRYSGEVIKDKVIKQTMHGLSLAWSYFPHWPSIRCQNLRTPQEVFEDDELFMKAIRKRLSIGTYISDSGMRKILKTYTGTQAVSNFRPTAAKAIYDLFAGGGVVYDMSAGFGGRLLGALSSNKVKKYIGTDPSTKTYEGLLKMKEDFGHLKEIEIHNIGSEMLKLPQYSVDLCFTSPPYFNTAKYSKEGTQSYLLYPTRELWVDGFLRKTLLNCYDCLKKEGYLIINIANVKSFPDLEKITTQVAKECGYRHIDTFRYTLSAFSEKKMKYEPVFVFRKEILEFLRPLL